MIQHPAWGVIEEKIGGRLDYDVPMKEHTTFGVGGPARVLARPETVEELTEIIIACRCIGLPYYILGAGSNILFLDNGFDGVVIKLGRNFRGMEYQGGGIIVAGAAAPVGLLLEMALDLELGGLECLAGIPGTLGGAIRMNAGSFGATIGPLVDRVRYVEGQGQPGDIPGSGLKFSYRSVQGLPEAAVIVGAELKLGPGQGPALRATVQERLNQRAERHPKGARCAGSIFKNPPEIPAGKLIEECGFKGVVRGGAKVSEMHANFIINPESRAKSSDILELMREIIDSVRQVHGLTLEPEIKIVGSEGETRLR